jgi:hypothetical protein
MNDGIHYDIAASFLADEQRGKTILLLGTAKDGPVNVPVNVTDLANFAKIFGDSKQGTLGRAFEQVYNTNQNLAIYVMRITGSQASTQILGVLQSGKPTCLLKVTSRYGGSQYNNLYVTIENNAFRLRQRDDDGNTINLWEYTLDNYDYIGDLVRVLNKDAQDNTIPVYLSTDFVYEPISTLVTWMNNIENRLFGGDDGIDIKKDDLYIALESAYEMLQGLYIDVIVPVGAFLDDAHPVAFYGQGIYGTSYYAADRDYLSLIDTENNNHVVTFHEQLINFCRKQESFGVFTHGVIGLNPVEDPSFVTDHPFSYIIRLLQATAFKDRYGFAEFNQGNWIDHGHYVSVVAGEFVWNKGTEEEYFDNGYLVYAAMIASLFGKNTTTNQPVPAPVDLRYEFLTEELTEMANMGVVSFRRSVKRGIVVANGVTAALPDSDLHYIANVRMIQLTMAMVDQVIEPYIGANMVPVIANKEIEKAVDTVLQYLQEQGILIAYDYSVTFDRNARSCQINLSLMPRYAFEFISSSVGFQFKGQAVSP